MPDTVLGMPLHPLVLHAVVVLVPLTAVGTILLALVPRLRPMLRWPVLALLAPAVLAVPVTIFSGRNLRRDLLESQALGGSAADIVQEHAQWGQLLIWPVLAMAILAVALVWLDLKGGRPGLLKAVVVAAVLVSAWTIVHVMRVGHLGSKAVWNPGG